MNLNSRQTDVFLVPAARFELALCFQNCPLKAARLPFRQTGILNHGWDGRDRTSDTRYQKPLPYRLATSQ